MAEESLNCRRKRYHGKYSGRTSPAGPFFCPAEISERAALESRPDFIFPDVPDSSPQRGGFKAFSPARVYYFR